MNRMFFIACLFVFSNQAFTQNSSCELIDGAEEIQKEFDANAGCKDETACNFDEEKLYTNNDLCSYECYGCMDDGTDNSYSDSGIFENPRPNWMKEGDSACNYDPSATKEDGSCFYPEQEWLNCEGCCNIDSDKDGICDEEEKMVEEAMQKHLEDGKNPEDFICAFKPKCLDDCGVVNGDNSSCTDSCGVVNGDGSSCVEPKEESAIVKLFREGGTGFMMCVLICLILGLAICIERIIYLMMASSNSNVLLSKIEAELKNGQIENAKEVCRNTAGPTASICLQGLERSNESVESIEKSIMAYGSVQMGLLEKGTSWISLFIAIAPMLGFMGTVIGMIGAFNSIEAAGDISPSLVAGGIKQALLTTVFGLIVAIILQIFYNFIISKIDDIVNDMEDTSIALVDLIASNKK